MVDAHVGACIVHRRSGNRQNSSGNGVSEGQWLVIGSDEGQLCSWVSFNPASNRDGIAFIDSLLGWSDLRCVSYNECSMPGCLQYSAHVLFQRHTCHDKNSSKMNEFDIQDIIMLLTVENFYQLHFVS